MKIDITIIGQFALHLNGYGPVMKIVGHDIDNNLHLRYKCQWNDNCQIKSSLFKRSELVIFSEVGLAANKQKVVKVVKNLDIIKVSSPHLDHLGNIILPYTEEELTKIYSCIN